MDVRAGRFVLTQKPTRFTLDQPFIHTQEAGRASYQFAQSFYRKHRL